MPTSAQEPLMASTPKPDQGTDMFLSLPKSYRGTDMFLSLPNLSLQRPSFGPQINEQYEKLALSLNYGLATDPKYICLNLHKQLEEQKKFNIQLEAIIRQLQDISCVHSSDDDVFLSDN